MSAAKNKPAPVMELVLGAGGAKVYGHIGVLKSIEKHKIPIGDVTGVSIGSLIAAFYCNGFSASQIQKILAKEAFLTEGSDTVRRWYQALTPKALQSTGLVNLGPIMQRIVQKYKLVPTERLKIVAYNVSTMSPVVFSGTKYQLGLAIAASCSVPVIMSPVREKLLNTRKQETFVDGALYHTHPVKFCKGPAIVSKLGFARSLPVDWLPLTEGFLHFAEMANSMILDWLFDDPESPHILIDSGMPEVATLSFGSSYETCKKMVTYGERQANRQFKLATMSGRLPLVS